MTEAMGSDSPPLEVFKPNYNPRKSTPPPFESQEQSSQHDDTKYESKNLPRSKKIELRFGQREADDALWRNSDSHGYWRPESNPSPVELGRLSYEALERLERPQLPPMREQPNPPNKHPKFNSDQFTLPALQDPSTGHSPNASNTKLPPIHTQLGPVLPPPPTGPPTRTTRAPSFSLPPVTTISPPLTRVEPSPRDHYRVPLPQSKIPPTPYSHPSPVSLQAASVASSPVSQQPCWRGAKPLGPYPYDSQPIASNRSPAASYPTPIDHASACDPGSFTPSSQGNVATAPTGTFKCSHPGCSAAPFQTQYLLNSHANVHSQDRPHFCPIDGCPRGPGGKGFKRKNEMIRHGLVHNSPGYVCPFCPDQQHKYPRPDNLQRHVRVHHVDKNKDDPALRHVLSQRPEGSGRGRRRRINPQ
ncbi:hypothetical protein ASPVEDRAFT_78062 [Aspergillus versicolor CBS 583.65]|uniref:C2H2-type domain-containing protein n=1 Tax=Aspergillus versicolor CBS 583.65 TaxID=1036611 RepID=A0A1L9P440_ASPVE|nr:uncharacterized protein ASPVEDRAFT_78062 [Aspergillus versicolor CBS 583.65]OJI96289.1 hypothetical protein ASPVEDRAFT_78062 [Aspergillus versicolor CBS 583.65]